MSDAMMNAMAQAIVDALIKSKDGDVKAAIDSIRKDIEIRLEKQISDQLFNTLGPKIMATERRRILTPEFKQQLKDEALEKIQNDQTQKFNDYIIELAYQIGALGSVTDKLEDFVPKAGQYEFGKVQNKINEVNNQMNKILRNGKFKDMSKSEEFQDVENVDDVYDGGGDGCW